MGEPEDYLIRRRQHGKAGGGSTHVGTLLYSYVYIVVVMTSSRIQHVFAGRAEYYSAGEKEEKIWLLSDSTV